MNRVPLIPIEEVREYRIATSAVFSSTTGPFGALSNMARGFPVVVQRMTIPSIEALYQALRFPDNPEIQKDVIRTENAWLAKRIARQAERYTRSDWFRVRVRIMRWCLRLKLGHHPERFGSVLISTGQVPIVERSARDAFWGAGLQRSGTLVGVNALGRLLMELREEFIDGEPDAFRMVPPPDVPKFILGAEVIGALECAPMTVPNDGEVPWIIDPN